MGLTTATTIWTLIFALCSFLFTPVSAVLNNTGAFTGKTYPDLRGATRGLCGEHLPTRSYLCDPNGSISHSEAQSLNVQLHDLTNATKCKCKRIGQCVGEDLQGNHVEVGFIVAVAFARRLFMSVSNPNMSTIMHVADQFCTNVRGRWALGDCGNTAIILIWEEYNLLYIRPDRLTKLYLTASEIDTITKKVKDLVEQKQYRRALDIVLKDIEKEIQGKEEKRIDIGELSLITSVAVAIVFVVIITGCVCAFRCCGNLRPDGDSALGQTLERVDTLKAEMMKRGSMLRRSLSRSPKLPHHQSPSPNIHRLDHAAPLIQTTAVHHGGGVPSPGSAASRQLLASMAAQQQMPKRTNMARLASPYYGVEDGHSMV